jgi:hypothetical protein
VGQVGHLLGASRVDGLQIQQQSETVEIPLDIIVAWVSFLKRQLSARLRLGRCLQPNGDGRDPDLRAFRVKIAAETLEVGTEVQHEPAQRLVQERLVRRNLGENGDAVRLYFVQSGRAVILPAGESGGRHQATSKAAKKAMQLF